MTYSLALAFGRRPIDRNGEDSSDDSEELSGKHRVGINKDEVV